MAVPYGQVYLRPGGATLFRTHTAKRFARRNNPTLLKIDALLPKYEAVPRDERGARTALLVALADLTTTWLNDKQSKIDKDESFRAAAIQDLHTATLSELRGLKNWDKARSAFKKLIPAGSVRRDAAWQAAPVRVMHETSWLEVIDPQHRRGQELRKHLRAWNASTSTLSFWEYLESLDPDAAAELASVSVKYVDDDFFRALFEVGFEGGRMFSAMNPVAQNMILSRFARGTVIAQAVWQPLDTTQWPAKALLSLGGSGWAAFVLSAQNVLYAGVHSNGVFHHSSFLKGTPVLASGMMRVENGRVKAIHEKNGHYQSQSEHLATFLRLLMREMPATDWHAVDYISFGGHASTVGAVLGLPSRPAATRPLPRPVVRPAMVVTPQPLQPPPLPPRNPSPPLGRVAQLRQQFTRN